MVCKQAGLDTHNYHPIKKNRKKNSDTHVDSMVLHGPTKNKETSKSISTKHYFYLSLSKKKIPFLFEVAGHSTKQQLIRAKSRYK